MISQEQEHKIDPGGIFCTIGICMCFILGLTIGIIISHDNSTNTDKNNTPIPIPPPPNPTSEISNISESPMPVLVSGNASDYNIDN